MTPRLKILMLEDSIDDAEMIQNVLLKQKPSIEFKLVMTEDSFIDGLDQFRPDLILSDNSLPQFNATEALEIINKRSLDIPFILITGTVSEEFAASIIKLGADDYILKDRLVRLPSAIESALEKKHIEHEKKEVQKQLKQSEERYRLLFQNSPLPKWMLNRTTHDILDVNEAAILHYGYSQSDFLSMNMKDILPDGEIQAGNPSRYSGYVESGEWKHIKKDGTLINVEIFSHDFIYNTIPVKLVIAVDVTERKKAAKAMQLMEQEMLMQKVQEQKKIARAIIKAQERERNHIGQELHDNINQILVATKLYLKIAGDNRPDIRETIRYSMDLIDNSINEIRLLASKHVTPPKDIHLKESLQWLIETFENNTGIKAQFDYDVSEKEMDDDLELNIYRIIQEQINNIIKHAFPKNVSIVIKACNNMITMAIADDGKGFEVDKKRKGIGISNIINRVESYNGEVTIESAPGEGCTIQMKIPY